MISLIRGDTLKLKFKRKTKTGQIITVLPERMYITFKTQDNNKEMLFQKTLGNDIFYDDESFYYSFTIESEDTDNLEYGTYDFDIEVIEENGDKKTIYIDTLKITKEITFVNNEG